MENVFERFGGVHCFPQHPSTWGAKIAAGRAEVGAGPVGCGPCLQGRLQHPLRQMSHATSTYRGQGLRPGNAPDNTAA